MLIGAFSGVAFQQIGEYARAGAPEVPKDLQTWQVGKDAFVTGSKYAEVVALHAVAGGVISVLNGSKFGNGFVSAGFTKSLGHSIAQLGDNQELQSLVTVIVGGTASRLSGGKFANGATTAASQVALNFFGSEGKSDKGKKSSLTEEEAREVFKQIFDKKSSELKQLPKKLNSGHIQLAERMLVESLKLDGVIDDLGIVGISGIVSKYNTKLAQEIIKQYNKHRNSNLTGRETISKMLDGVGAAIRNKEAYNNKLLLDELNMGI